MEIRNLLPHINFLEKYSKPIGVYPSTIIQPESPYIDVHKFKVNIVEEPDELKMARLWEKQKRKELNMTINRIMPFIDPV